MFPKSKSSQSKGTSKPAAANSPSLSPVEVSEEEGEGEMDEEIANEDDEVSNTLVMMGAGEPVKINSGSNRTTAASSNGPTRVLSRLHVEDDDQDEEKAKRSVKLAIKTKVLHFTVSLLAPPFLDRSLLLMKTTPCYK